MRLKINKEIYSKVAVLKAAYVLTNKAYILIDADNDNYYVDITERENGALEEEKVTGIFKNELLSQMLRIHINDETREIRTIIASRALASTIVDHGENNILEDSNDIPLESVLKDWFDE